jgi:hypothetical protein
MKTALLRYWLVVLLGFPMLALNAQTTLIVQGYVNNLTNQPIAGKIVTIQIDSVFAAPAFAYSGTVVTGANGYYVDSVQLPAGANNAMVLAHVVDCNNATQYNFQWYNAPAALPLMNFAICNSLPVAPCDVGVLSIIAPSSTINANSLAQIVVTVKNFGTATQSLIPVYFQINNQSNIQTGIITNSIPPNDSITFTFSGSTLFGNGVSQYQIKSWTGLSCDSIPLNDTAVKLVTVVPPVYCISSATTTANTEITKVSFSTMNNGWQTSGVMYTNYGNFVPPPSILQGISYPIDITSSFALGSTTQTPCWIKAWIDFNHDSLFDPINELVFSQSTTSNNIASGLMQIPMSALAGITTMRIVLQATSNPALVNPCGTYSEGETEDYKVMIVPIYVCDAAIVQISSPSCSSVSGIPVPVVVTVMNFGLDTIPAGSISVSYQLNNNAPVSMLYPQNLYPFQMDSVILSPVNLPSGNNTFCAYTTLLCDSNSSNNASCITINTTSITALPFSSTFDSTNTFYTDAMGIWQLGTPNASIINSAYSGNNAWATVLNGNYPNNTQTYLYTPVYNFAGAGLTSSDTVMISFFHWMNFADVTDFGQVQYSTDGGLSWDQLGFFGDPSGTNWVNAQIGGIHRFNHPNSGWIYSSYKLWPGVFNSKCQVQFRFRFASNGSGTANGWAIDNFKLELLSPQPQFNDVGIVSINFPVMTNPTGSTVYPSVTIKNFGSNPQMMIPVGYGIWSVTSVLETWTGYLPGFDSVVYTFSTPYIVPPSDYLLCSSTYLPGDLVNNNNTVCDSFSVVSAPIGYLYGMLTSNASAAGPSQVYLIEHNALPGTLTAIDTTLSVDSSGVTTYHFANITPGNYLVKAAMLPSNPNYAANIPSYHQSAIFWNQATTVNVLPNTFTQANISYVQGINPGGPGFVGGLVSQGANKGPGDPIEGVQLLLLDVMNNDQPVAVTFSDAAGHFEFTNIPFGTFKVYAEMLNKTTHPVIVTVDAANPSNDAIQIVVGATVISFIDHSPGLSMGAIGHFYPNPASAFSSLNVTLTQNASLRIEISDLTGHILSTQTVEKNAGQHLLEFDLSTLSRGMYIVSVKGKDGSGVIRKLVIH